MFPLPGVNATGEIDPVQLRAVLRGVMNIEEKIEAFAASGVAPAYFVESLKGMYTNLNRWADEVEAARNGNVAPAEVPEHIASELRSLNAVNAAMRMES